MEEVARRHELPWPLPRHSSSGQEYATSFKVDQELLERIRTVLASHEEQRLPQTRGDPGKGNQYAQKTADPACSQIGFLGIYAVEAAQEPSGTFDFSTAKSVADLAQSSVLVPNTNKGRSVVPASQSRVKRLRMVQTRRGFTGPGKGDFGGGTVTPIEVAAHSEMAGNGGKDTSSFRSTTHSQPAVLSSKDRSSNPKNHLTSGSGFQSGRATPQPYKKRPRSAIHHVPGSYRSEHDVSLDFEPATARSPLPTPTNSGLSVDGSNQKQDLPASLGLESPTSLDLSVTPMDEFQTLYRSDTVIRIRRSVSSLQERPEQTVDGSHTSHKPNHRLMLLKTSALPSDMGVPAPPILTPGIGDSQALDKDLQPDVNSENRPEVPKKLPSSPDTQLAADCHVQSANFTGKPLAELLSELPPLKQAVIDDFEGQNLTAKITALPPVVSYDRDISSRNSHSQESTKGSTSQSTFRDYTVKRSDSYKSLVRHIDSLPRKASSVALGKSKDRLSVTSANPTISVEGPLQELDPQSISRTSSFDARDHGVTRRLETYQVTPQRAVVVPHADQSPQGGERTNNTTLKKHWIRNLLQRAPPNQSLQTSSPHPTARSAGRIVSSAPAATTSARSGQVPGEGSLNTSSTKELEANEEVSANEVQDADDDYQRTTSESFTKIILELEQLLNEAILVARQAAEQNATEELPRILGEAALVLKSGNTMEPYAASRNQPPSKALSQGNELDIEHQAVLHGVADTFVSDSAFETDLASSPDFEQHLEATGSGFSQTQPASGITHNPPFAIPKDYIDEVQPNDPTQLPMQSNATTPRRFYASSDRLDCAASTGQRQNDTLPKTVYRRRFSVPDQPSSAKPPAKDSFSLVERGSRVTSQLPSKDVVHEHIRLYQEPPIQPRMSSSQLRTLHLNKEDGSQLLLTQNYQPDYRDGANSYMQSPGVGASRHGRRHNSDGYRTATSGTHKGNGDVLGNDPSKDSGSAMDRKGYSLRDRHHFSIREPHGFSISRSHRHQPIARDWSDRRKRYVAAVACVSTALIGLLVGIYAGEVPAIQYQIVDFHHYTILGNVFLYIGLAVSTLIFWPLPLLHGRKPYTLLALVLLLPLQFPQAIVVSTQRSPYVATYRIGLLLPRTLSGLAMGFANINFKATLLDLFGASLQSSNPHQEVVNEHDVRRHGGGMGIWLGIWTWCFIGSLGLGFFIGAVVISALNPAWGFWIVIIVTAAVLLLNVLVPEVRRSPYRRSVAEVRSGTDISRRVARGEVKMHLESTGPKWWWEEVSAGLRMSIKMLRQPGFAILSLYLAWIYGQIVLVIVLLGALISKYYRFRPEYVGLCVAAVPIGALLAIPFQKASIFSRSRRRPPRTDSMTFERRVTWTSHLLRRLIFMISLPFADLAYTLSSKGPPTHYMVPTTFAALIGFLSTLAIAECNGLIMETYDTSDLQPGMTGRPRSSVPEDIRRKRTNFSCFPRVSAGLAVTQSLAFLMAALGTGVGGVVERNIGARAATGVVAGILLALTLLLTVVLWRSWEIQVIPSPRTFKGQPMPGEDSWRPVIIGNPSGKMRRMNVLELGEQSRWTEIRRKNRLI
ncbi:MAG: hypothetical protein M1835_007054 [Candelina submexicana]|nr:MAG: hypothetical protein M1835_007054 [Candelina submexicana]